MSAPNLTFYLGQAIAIILVFVIVLYIVYVSLKKIFKEDEEQAHQSN